MPSRRLQDARTAAWHLRHGGIAQLREWRRRRALGVEADASRGGGGFDPMDLPAWEPTPLARPFGGVRVGVILDDFSLAAWGGEFELVELRPTSWRDELGAGIDLLFVESAWNGIHGAWAGHLTGSRAPSEPLRELVAECRQRGIPTAFWNKEDPPHFEDFLDTARLFDRVFTSDADMIPAYRERLGHDRVEVMQFAAQPSIHSPVRKAGIEPEGDVAFAGMYFAHKYPERREQMELLLGAAERASAKLPRGVAIYSRFAGGDERYQFPEPYAGRVVGSLPYATMLTAYRAHKVFLNVNSVVDSPSMCARRVFEITASGTPVVSAPSAAIPRIFPQDEVPVVSEPDEAERMIRALANSPQLRDRMVHRAQRRIWAGHTYAHRAAQLLEASGIALPEDPRRAPRVTAICSTNRPGQLEHLLGQAARQRGVELQLAVLAHGFELDGADFRAKAAERGVDDVVVLHGDASLSLGECLNRLIDAADGELLAKLDDDDVYGPDYLLDQAYALRYSGADLVGKQASYAYLAAQDALVLRYPWREHRFSTFVAGPTFCAPADTFRGVRFAARTRGEDTDFLRRLGDAGGRAYSADRFNFIQVRGATPHTWPVDDLEFLANGVVETYGRGEGHVLVPTTDPPGSGAIPAPDPGPRTPSPRTERQRP